MTDEVSIGITPGTCVMHGWHGMTTCPRCSSSVWPLTLLMSGRPTPPTKRSDIGCDDARALVKIAKAAQDASEGLRRALARLDSGAAEGDA